MYVKALMICSAPFENQKQREKNEKARTDMVTGISHDLRTPLTSIQGYIKGVLDGVADTKEKAGKVSENRI